MITACGGVIIFPKGAGCFSHMAVEALDTFKEFVLSLPEKEEKKNAQPKKK